MAWHTMVVDADDAVDADAEVVEKFNGVTCISDNVFWNDLNFLCDKRVSLQTNNHMCCGHLHLGPLVFSLWSSPLLEVCSPHYICGAWICNICTFVLLCWLCCTNFGWLADFCTTHGNTTYYKYFLAAKYFLLANIIFRALRATSRTRLFFSVISWACCQKEWTSG